MKSGIYALASLSGAPLDPGDLSPLKLAEGDDSFRVALAGCHVRAHDPTPGAISIANISNALYVFAGFLDEAQELAERLRLPADAGPASLAAAAIDHFGKEAPAHMLGEWSLLKWDGVARQLTVVASETLRDSLAFALGEGYIAIAPDVLTLSRLRWVGRALDREGYALGMSRAGLRHIRTEQTLWKGIRVVRPGATEIFSAERRRSALASRRTEFPLFPGTFEEAVEAIDHVGRHIVRQHMERQGKIAFQLSGGLDSTVLTCWGAAERAPGREMFCVSSVAPPGSGEPDESRFIRGAAAMLQVPVTECWAAQEGEQGQLFSAPAHLFEEFAAPISGPYRTHEAMDAAAAAGGATAMICGAYGEMHVSNGFDIPETRSWLRRRVAAALDAQARRRQHSGWPQAAFSVRFTPEFLSALPRDWGAVWRRGLPPEKVSRKADATIGISRLFYKNAHGTTAGTDGLRQFLIYRDQRLMRLTAGMPASFLSHGGLTRPLARRLLQGKVSEALWRREHGRGFAPDFASQLKAQAARPRARIAAFAAAGVGRWIDLPWLDAGLARLQATRAQHDTELFYGVQATAINAEFLLWALTGGVEFAEAKD